MSVFCAVVFLFFTCSSVLLGVLVGSASSQCTSGDLRLRGGGADYGRVEVCVGETWGTICDDFWQNQDASVVCHQLGYSRYGAIAARGSFTDTTLPVHIIDLNCTGTEETVLQCPYNNLLDSRVCLPHQDASVRCQGTSVIPSNCSDGDVRLNRYGRTDFPEGRVQVCVNRVWGSVCYSTSTSSFLQSRTSNTWDVGGTEVVCRQLGYQALGSTAHITSFQFGRASSNGAILLSNVMCTGSEPNLLECPHTVFVGTHCVHNRDVGATCEPPCTNGTIRLAGTSATNYGRVEVCVNNMWGTICDQLWSLDDASVVCKQLGYSEYGALATRGNYTDDVWPFYIQDLNCTGDEDNIWDCPHNGVSDLCTSARQDASVRCQDIADELATDSCYNGQVRLAGGSSYSEGRVELCINRMWGTVCSEGWSASDARVVCRLLGYLETGAVLYPSSTNFFGAGSDPVFLSNLRCTGREYNLLQCPSTYFLSDSCFAHYKDAGLKCEAKCDNGSVRLVSESGSSFRRYGRVEVCVQESWNTICSQYFNELVATVVCHQLGYSRYGAIPGEGIFTDTAWPRFQWYIFCNGTEDNLLDCVDFNYTLPGSPCSSSRVASVVCQPPALQLSHCADGELRLAADFAGFRNLQVCYNLAWGSVCNYRWSNIDAVIACRQLGKQPIYGSTFRVPSDAGNVPTLIYNSQCQGSEFTLDQCDNSVFPSPGNGCGRFDGAVVKCVEPCIHGDVELFGSSVARAGVVRVCINGVWGKVCDGWKDPHFASIVCSQLGFSPYGANSARNVWHDNVYRFHMFQPVCTENDTELLNCSYSETDTLSSCTTPSDSTSVVCLWNDIEPVDCVDGSVQLTGESSYRGRLEICRNNVSGTVCAPPNTFQHIGFSEGQVACQMLGHQTRGFSIFTTNTTRQNPPMYTDFECSNLRDSAFDECDTPSGLKAAIEDCGPGVIGLECVPLCEDGEIKLSRTRNYGGVQVCVSGEWGIICDRGYWDDADARVVCSQLGFLRNGSIAVRDDNFYSAFPAVFSMVECNGTEDNISQCALDDGGNQCSGGFASVFCQDQLACTTGAIRLAGGTSPANSRVEVCINGFWTSLCSTNFDTVEADIVCAELGYQGLGSTYGAYYGRGAGPVVGTFSCQGEESSLYSCYHSIAGSCGNYQQGIGVECEVPCVDGAVRIAGGRFSYEGRVDVCVNSTWGTICSDFWDLNDAMVLCRQLGFSASGSTVGFPERSVWPNHVIDLSCDGTEASIWDCPRNQQPGQACTSYSKDGRVTCAVTVQPCTAEKEGAVRLVGGSSEYKGRVEICSEGQWGTVCDPSWGDEEAAVVCQQLGYPVPGAVSTQQYRYHRDSNARVRVVYFDLLNCSGDEAALLSCPHNIALAYCSYVNDVGAICRAPCANGRVQLYTGDSAYNNRGRVEVCMDGVWGSVCNDIWTHHNARVMCRELGFSPYGAVAERSAYLQPTTLRYFIAATNCSGDEEGILSCPYSIFTSNSTCTSGSAGLSCQANALSVSNYTNYGVRLDPGNGGKLMISFNSVWGEVCSGGLVEGAASVVCHQLGYSRSDYSTILLSYSQNTLKFDQIVCSGSEEDISQCVLSLSSLQWCDQDRTIGLQCKEKCLNGSVRLAGSDFSRHGRVEVCLGGDWGTVCNETVDSAAASVICRQLGFSPYGATVIHGSYSDTTNPMFIGELNCTGSETAVWPCAHNNVSASETCNPAAVVCQPEHVQSDYCSNGDLRIRNTSSSLTNETSGRLELCQNQVWFAIQFLSPTWDATRRSDPTIRHWNGFLACQTLGYSGLDYSTYIINYLDQDYVPLYPLSITCSSDSDSFSLAECSSRYVDSEFTATALYTVGIRCQHEGCHGQVRITDTVSPTKLFGSVEVCIDESWIAVCDEFWDDRDASVICRQLGYSSDGAVAFFMSSASSRAPVVNSLNCTGEEGAVLECEHSYSTRLWCASATILCQDAPVVTDCVDNSTRLIGGPTPYEGTVEVCRNRVWGGVCQNRWGVEDANVVCTQLGFQTTGAAAVRDSFYGSATGFLYLTSVNCAGTERKLSDCRYSVTAVGCGDLGHAGVKCLAPCVEGHVRFSGSTIIYGGRVQICSNLTWTTVCSDTWDDQAADVVCSQLGFVPYGASSAAVPGQLTLGVTDVLCNGTEENITACVGDTTQLETLRCRQHANVVCLVIPEVALIAYQTRVIPASTVTLRCRVLIGNPMNYTYFWAYENTPLVSASSETLVISQFGEDDAGNYSCEAMNDVGSGMDNITLELGVPPQVTSSTDQTGPIIEGSTIQLTCEAVEGDLPVSFSWTAPDGRSVSSPNTDGTVWVTLASSTDYGDYTCVGSNEFGSASVSTEVIRPVPPVVEPSVDQVISQTIINGDALTLSATISAFNLPLTSITWTHQGATISASEEGVNITHSLSLPASSGPVESTLILGDTVPQDGGSYVAMATNAAGTGTLEFTVTVTAPVTITDPLMDTSVTAYEGLGNDFSFTCTVRGVPAPSVAWFPRPGGVRKRTSSHSVEDSDGFFVVTSTFTIHNVEGLYDWGHYTCIASDPESGTVTRVFTLSVLSSSGPVLSVFVLPTTLFTGGRLQVTEGSSIWLHCEVNSISPTQRVTWTRNHIQLSQDLPHIYTRNWRDGNSTLSLLIVDGFQSSDDGFYQCSLRDGFNSWLSTQLTLTASSATNPGSLQLLSTTANSNTFSQHRAAYRDGDAVSLECSVGHMGEEDSTQFPTPQVVWLKDWAPARVRPVNNALGPQGQLNSTLSFVFDEESDAGLYQCVIIDGRRSVMFVAHPIRLDTGEVLSLEAVSPSTLIFTPPEELTLEVRAKGHYSSIQWSRNGIAAGSESFATSPQSFVHFGEVYNVGASTVEDLGAYDVVLDPAVNSSQSLPTRLRFNVLLPEDAQTNVTDGDTAVSVRETASVNISCTSSGLPVPTITWTHHNTPVRFDQTDTSTDPVVEVLSAGEYALTQGHVVSTLHVADAHYPEDEGTYMCVGSNTHGDTTTTSSASISLLVFVAPVVELSADSTQVLPGDQVSLSCAVTRGSPSVYTYMWTLDSSPLIDETSATLNLTSFSEGDAGRYGCVVRNEAGEGRDNITIQLGVYPGAPVNVTTINAGSRWITLQWTPTSSGSSPILSYNLYMRNVSNDGNFFLVGTPGAGAPGEGGAVVYNVTRVVVPYVQYSFKVEACNEIGCGEESEVSDVRRTAQDTASAPLNLRVFDLTDMTLSLEWSSPLTPHGPIFAYEVSFHGYKSYDSNFSHMDTRRFNISELQRTGGVYRGVVTGLVPGTTYQLTVAGVNGAARNDGLGVSSDPVSTHTLTDAPPAPVVPSLPPVNSTLQTLTLPLPQFSTVNGPISHYHVVVVLLPVGQTLTDQTDPDSQYSSLQDLDTYRETYCDESILTPKAYITAEFGAELLPASGLFAVGGEGVNAPNDRPALYTNGLLCFGRSYTFFVRAYPLLDDSSTTGGRQARRQVTERQYTVFSSSGYFAPTIIATPTELLFQLRLLNVSNCAEWTSDNPLGKASEIVQQVTRELNRLCQCNFEASQITNAHIRCFPGSLTAVTFRAKITEFDQLLATQLTAILQAWVLGSPQIVAQNQLLTLDYSCVVLLSSLDEAECGAEVTVSSSTTAATSTAQAGVGVVRVGVSVGVVLVLLLVVVMVTVVLIVWHRRRKSKVYETALL